MSKTYADQCLERAQKATKRPWISTSEKINIGFTREIIQTIYGVNGPNASISFNGSKDGENDAEFIAHSRVDVEELAKRLNMAIEALQKIGYWKSDANICCFPVDCYSLSKELEEIPEGDQ